MIASDEQRAAGQIPEVAHVIAARFAAAPEVVAVAMAGSRATGRCDAGSDIDLYVYAMDGVSIGTRAAIAAGTVDVELDQSPWEPGDSWVDPLSGATIDVMYRAPSWIEAELDQVLVRHEASIGYSTCFWHNVLTSVPLFDREGWFVRLQRWSDQPFPEPLRLAINAKNHPLLRDGRFSFLSQAEAALRRHDGVAVQHRIAALLASYFDILFALNRRPHPGEKRLIELAEAEDRVPLHLGDQVEAVLRAAAPPWTGDDLIPAVHCLIDDLDDLVRTETRH